MTFAELSLELRGILNAVFPGIDLHEEMPQLDKDAVDNIFWRLTQYGLNDAQTLAAELSDFISSLNRNGDFMLVNETIQRPASRLVVSDIPLVEKASQWDSHFKTSLISAELPPEIRLGRILYSAMRFGGLLSESHIEALYHMLRSHQRPFVLGQVVWFELTDRNNATLTWLPDALTLVLITAWLGKTSTLGKASWLGKRKAWSLIVSDFLFTGASQRKQSRIRGSDIIKGIAARLAIEITPALIDIATGHTLSVSLKQNTFLRLLTKKSPKLPVEPPKKRSGSGNDLREKFSSTYDRAFSTRIASLISESKRHSPAIVSDRIKDEIDSFQGKINPNLLHTSLWLATRLVTDGAWSKPLAPTTAHNRFSKLNRLLASIENDQDFLSLSQNQIAQLYRRPLEDTLQRTNKEAKGQTHQLAVAIRDFHDFMVREYDIDHDYEADKYILRNHKKRLVQSVDAEVLMPWEYEEIKAYLVEANKRLKNTKASSEEADLNQMLLVILILGYRAGMRRSEVHYLRIADIHIPQIRDDGHRTSFGMECVVSPNEKHDLKSPSATRRIPIGILLTDFEKKVFVEFYRKRLEKSGRDEFLFNTASNPRPYLESRVLFEPIHWLLRSATGNPAMRFHHLRHSFATWNFWEWMSSKWAGKSVITSLSNSLSLNKIQLERKAVLGLSNGAAPSRKVLHALSMMIGHSHPSTTIRHYIHSAPILLHAELNLIQPRLLKKELAKIATISARGLLKISSTQSKKQSGMLDADESMPSILWDRCVRILKRDSDLSSKTIGFRKVKAKSLAKFRREPSGERIYLIDLYMAAYDYFEGQDNVRYLEEKYGVYPQALTQTLEQADKLFSLEKTIGNRKDTQRPRHYRKVSRAAKSSSASHAIYSQRLPPLSRQKRELLTIEKMMVSAQSLRQRQKAKLRKMLDYFAENSTAYDHGIEFTKRRDLDAFVSSIRLLALEIENQDGLKNERIRITIWLPDLSQTTKESARMYWNKVIQFKNYQIDFREKKRRLKHTNGYVLLDLIAPQAIKPSKKNSSKRRPADSGFSVGLYILYLTTGHWDAGKV